MELWRKNLYWLVLIQVLAGSAIVGVISFIPLFVYELGVTDAGAASMWAGMITGVTALTAAIANPYWGAYGDRKGQKRIMLQILLALTVIMALMSLVQSPAQLFILRALQGAVGGFIAAGLAMVVTQTPKKNATYALGTYQTGIVLGATLGPLIGGAVADIIGYRETFLFFAALALIGAVITRRNVHEDFTPQTKEPKESVFDNLKLFLSIPVVRLMMIMQFMVNFALTGVGPILPLYIKSMVNNTAAIASISGFIIALGGFASAFTSMNMGRIVQWLTHRSILLTGALATAILFIFQYFAPNVYIFGFLRMLTGFSIGALMPSANTIIANNVPHEKRGIAFGVTSSATLMGNVAGPMVSGALALSFGMPSAFWSTALLFFIITILVYRNLTEETVKPHPGE